MSSRFYTPLIVIVTVLITFVITSSISTKAQQQVFSQTCNPGTIIRPNGAILIDAWKSYDNPIPGDPGAVKFPNTGTPQPTAIHLGHTLPNEVKVCIESEEGDGSECFPLFKFRHINDLPVDPHPDKTPGPPKPIKR